VNEPHAHRVVGEAVDDDEAAELAVIRIRSKSDGAIDEPRIQVYALPSGGGRYMVEEKPLVVPLVAERDLVSLRKEAKLGAGLLAIGGPDFDQQTDALASVEPPPPLPLPRAHRGTSGGCEALQSVRFDPLPASSDEAKAVAELWGHQAGAG
jgi:hypothetical protein